MLRFRAEVRARLGTTPIRVPVRIFNQEAAAYGVSVGALGVDGGQRFAPK
jgi:hypothetical protein